MHQLWRAVVSLRLLDSFESVSFSIFIVDIGSIAIGSAWFVKLGRLFYLLGWSTFYLGWLLHRGTLVTKRWSVGGVLDRRSSLYFYFLEFDDLFFLRFIVSTGWSRMVLLIVWISWCILMLVVSTCQWVSSSSGNNSVNLRWIRIILISLNNVFLRSYRLTRKHLVVALQSWMLFQVSSDDLSSFTVVVWVPDSARNLCSRKWPTCFRAVVSKCSDHSVTESGVQHVFKLFHGGKSVLGKLQGTLGVSLGLEELLIYW